MLGCKRQGVGMQEVGCGGVFDYTSFKGAL